MTRKGNNAVVFGYRGIFLLLSSLILETCCIVWFFGTKIIKRSTNLISNPCQPMNPCRLYLSKQLAYQLFPRSAGVLHFCPSLSLWTNNRSLQSHPRLFHLSPLSAAAVSICTIETHPSSNHPVIRGSWMNGFCQSRDTEKGISD